LPFSIDEARTAAKLYAAEVAKKIDPVAEKRAAAAKGKRERAQALGTFVEGRWHEWAQVHLRSHAETLAALRYDFGPSKGGRVAVCNWWSRSMADITALDVERWRRSKLRDGAKPATVNRAWDRLRAVLRRAIAWELITGPLPRVRKISSGDPRVRYLSSEERKRLFVALEERERERRGQRARMNRWLKARHRPPMPPITGCFCDHLQPLVRLILGTGLRRGEALQLKWGDVDSKQVHVRGETAKDQAFRAVPLTADAQEALRAWREQQTDAKPDAFVFVRSKGGSHQVNTSWATLMKRAQIKGFRLHDLRHDYASRLVMAGTPLYTVARLLGHASSETSERYSHLAPDHLRDAVAKLDALETRSAA
jgi:integrase